MRAAEFRCQCHVIIRIGYLRHTVLAVVTEPLAHGTAREGSKVLQRSGFGGGSSDDDGVLHGIVLLKGLDELSDGGTLLANGDVDTVELLRLVLAVVPPLLVENGVDSDGGLAGLTVTDDQFTLATTNGHHGVDGLDTGHHGLVDRAAGKNAGSLERRTLALGGVNGALAVDGVAQGVDDTAEETRADGNVDNLAGTLDGVALLDETIVTEDGDTDVVGLQVQAHATDTRGEFHHLFGCKKFSYCGIFESTENVQTLDILETVDASNSCVRNRR